MRDFFPLQSSCVVYVPMCFSVQKHVCVLACLSVQSGVSMELSCLSQTSGSVGREPWVNFKLLPPSR